MAVRAEVAAASGDDDALDRGVTSPARLAGPLVDAELRKVSSRLALNVDVVAKAGALASDGLAKDLLDRAAQAGRGFDGNASRRRERMQTSQIERLIGINVP